MTPMTPPASASAEWVVRYGVDVLLVDGRSTATVNLSGRRWRAWRQRIDRSSYHPTRLDAMRAVTPAWALDALPSAAIA